MSPYDSDECANWRLEIPCAKKRRKIERGEWASAPEKRYYHTALKVSVLIMI